MKIKKKPKLPTLTCKVCGCVFVPGEKDLRKDFLSSSKYKVINELDVRKMVYVPCPVCGWCTDVFKEGDEQ